MSVKKLNVVNNQAKCSEIFKHTKSENHAGFRKVKTAVYMKSTVSFHIFSEETNHDYA